MGKINCSIIKDLLPSYCDKMTSKTTNKAIEAHLQECEKCRKVWREMNKDIETGNLDIKDEQIDYLKKHKRKKIFAIIAACAATVAVLVTVFVVNIMNGKIRLEDYGPVDVNNFVVESMYIMNNGGPTGKTLVINMIATEYRGNGYMAASSGTIDVFMKIATEPLPGEITHDDGRLGLHIPITDETEHVYIESLHGGGVREVWNREMSLPTAESWQEAQQLREEGEKKTKAANN